MAGTVNANFTHPPRVQKGNLEISSVVFLLILCLFTFIIAFAYCWQPGWLDDDALSYAQTSRLIADSNQWLSFNDPSYGGKFYYHFPLVIWVNALIFKVFGVSVISAAIFSLISCLGCVIGLFFFGKLIKNKWVGFFAATVFLLINFTPRFARQSRMDMPVTFFIILSMYFFSKALGERKINYLLYGLFAGLAIMAKDIFGFAPLAIAVAFLLFSLKLKEFLNSYFLLSLVLAFAPLVSWIMLEQYLYGETIFSKWFSWNFLHVLKSPGYTTPAYYYPLEILKRFFYFVPFFIYGAYLAVKRFLARESELPLLILIWALIIPAAFSFGRLKLHYFIYSMYPAFALLCALAIERILKERTRLKVFYLLIFMIAAFGLLELSSPVRVGKVYFRKTVRLAPFIDNILDKAPAYEFYSTVGQDDTALMFYSKKLKKITSLADDQILARLNERNSQAAGFCLLDRQHYEPAKAGLSKKWSVLLEYKDTLLITDRPTQVLPITIPD